MILAGLWEVLIQQLEVQEIKFEFGQQIVEEQLLNIKHFKHIEQWTCHPQKTTCDWLLQITRVDCARLGGHWQDVENSNGSSISSYRRIQDILGVVMSEQGLVHWITQTYSTKLPLIFALYYQDNVHFGLFSDSYLTKPPKNWKPHGFQDVKGFQGHQKRPYKNDRPLHLPAAPRDLRHTIKGTSTNVGCIRWEVGTSNPCGENLKKTVGEQFEPYKSKKIYV